MFHKEIETVCADIIVTLLKDKTHTRHVLSKFEFLVLFWTHYPVF